MKIYVKPKIDIFTLNVSECLLAGSADTNATDITFGSGLSNNGDACARYHYSTWDDDE